MIVTITKTGLEKVGLDKPTMRDVFIKVLESVTEWRSYYYIQHGKVFWDDDGYHGSSLQEYVREATQEDILYQELVTKVQRWGRGD